MLQKEEHREKCGRNVLQTTVTDEQLLARRRAIMVEWRSMQTRHRRELKRLSRDHTAIMRELNWPLGCVTRPRVA